MSIKMLRRMGALRKRQHERLELALTEQRQLLAQREADVTQAQDEQERKAQAEAQAGAERDALTARSFAPPALIAMELRLQGCAQETQAAAQCVAEAQKAVVQQGAAVAASRFAVTRNEQRMKSLRERLDKALRDREQLEEDAEAEESEETFSSRIAARRKTTKEGSHA